MHLKRPLDDVFSNPNHVRVLRHLILYPSPVITGRGLARELGMSHVTCIRSLNALASLGIVNQKTVGTSTVYELPADSVVVTRILKPAFEEESKLLEGLASTLLEGIRSKVLSAYLFGSVARGDDTTESDVDILLVLKQGADKKAVENRLAGNSSAAYRLYRVGINVITYAYDEFQQMKQKGHPLVREVLSDGIFLKGKEV
jgi:predicted nucleotidyltransferase